VQRPLAWWQRKVRMPVAAGMFQRMPDNLRRWAMMALPHGAGSHIDCYLEVRDARFSRWSRTDCTSNQSSPRVVFAARARPLRGRVDSVGRGSDKFDHAAGMVADRIPLGYQRLKG
jgi:hypothetical protein